ncbi:MAG: hypothetical protein HGA96_02630 [Desulfobulbaceae bacterium]|nr:hypothetical protein [Desulfobulbaceae bacterium]
MVFAHHKFDNSHTGGGENSDDNLLTLCNICHGKTHAKDFGPRIRLLTL